jgi:glutamine amidotransferase
VIAVIDYRAGNLTSVVKALRHLGAEVTITDDAAVVRAAERIVLPGVGHFSATKRLDETSITAASREAIHRGVPFLGICVGMQWLLEGSEESPEQPGLAYFAGRCRRFPEGAEKVPHVGWNQIRPRPDARLFAGIAPETFVYFTHAYFVPATASAAGATPQQSAAATTRYITDFDAAVEHRNVMGVQFHPEKSGDVGLQVLRNFLEWQPC